MPTNHLLLEILSLNADFPFLCLIIFGEGLSCLCFGGPFWSQGLDLVIPVNPFQLGIFHDSLTLSLSILKMSDKSGAFS